MKRTLRNTLIALIIFTSSAFAAGTAGSNEAGVLISLFFGFFAMIVIFQLVPATLMMVGVISGLLGRDRKGATTH